MTKKRKQKQMNQSKPLDGSKLKQICTMIKSGRSRRNISAFIGISMGMTSRACEKLNYLSNGNISNLDALNPEQLEELYFQKPASIPEVHADSVKDGKYYPNFAELAAVKVFEQRQTVKEIYLNYVGLCQEKNADPLSVQYFYKLLKEQTELIKAKDPDYYFIQEFKYGEFLEVDYTGDKYTLSTYAGKRDFWIMVLTFPASYYTFAGFVSAQSTEESCRVLADAVKYFEYRLPDFLICDNAKCWVTDHSTSDVIYNRNFFSFTAEMNLILMAAPPYSPQCKSAVERSVGLIQSRIKADNAFLASLTEMKTLQEHSAHLQEFVQKQINEAPFRKNAEKTRDYLFKTYELNKLHTITFIPEYTQEIMSRMVPENYHIQVNEHQYSVPYMYIGKMVDLYVSNDYITIKYKGKEIARHQRTDGYNVLTQSCVTTEVDHMPREHQEIKAAGKRKLRSIHEIFVESRKLDPKIYEFCRRRINAETRGKDREKSYTPYLINAISTCNAIINEYGKVAFKPLFAQACENILNRFDPRRWVKNMVCFEYRDLLSKMHEKEKADSSKSGSIKVNRVSDEQGYFVSESSDSSGVSDGSDNFFSSGASVSRCAPCDSSAVPLSPASASNLSNDSASHLHLSSGFASASSQSSESYFRPDYCEEPFPGSGMDDSFGQAPLDSAPDIDGFIDFGSTSDSGMYDLFNGKN